MTSTEATVVTNGTPLRSTSITNNNPCCCISVVSYNVLAPAYVRPLDKRTGSIQPFAAFEWITEAESHNVLHMDNRGPRLYHILSHCHADIICLQELQLERQKLPSPSTNDDYHYYGLPAWIQPLMVEHGGTYCSVLPSQEELCKIAERNRRVLDIDSAVTVAILYRKDRFKPFVADTTTTTTDNGSVAKATTMNPQAKYNNHGKHSKKQQQQQQKQKQKKRNRDHHQEETQTTNSNRSVSICLQGLNDMEGMDPIVVASLHLDATDEIKRVGQLASLLKQHTGRIATATPSLIIAGDMNTEMESGSCVSAFLQQCNNNQKENNKSPTEKEFEQQCSEALRLTQDSAPSKQQLQQWKDLYREVDQSIKNEWCIQLSRIESGKTRAAYDHAVDSNSNSTTTPIMGQWALDHMIYSTHTLHPLSVWSTLETDKQAKKSGLPNSTWPSDHLPIGALFQLQKSPQLTSDERSMLVDRITALEQMQLQKLKNLTDTLDTQQAQIESKFCSPPPPPPPPQEEVKGTNKNNLIPNSSKKEKTKMQKKGPPPVEVREFMRERRNQIRAFRVELKLQRQTEINQMSVLERLLVKEIRGCNVNTWVERA